MKRLLIGGMLLIIVQACGAAIQSDDFESGALGSAWYLYAGGSGITVESGAGYGGGYGLHFENLGVDTAAAISFAGQTTGIVHIEFMARIAQEDNNAFFYGTQYPSDSNHNLGFDGNPGWVLAAYSGRAWVDIQGAWDDDPVWLPNVWQKWEMDYNLDNDKWNLTIAGVPDLDGNPWNFYTAGASISGVAFRAYGGAADFYIDNIVVTPEPATLVLLAAGSFIVGKRKRVQ